MIIKFNNGNYDIKDHEDGSEGGGVPFNKNSAGISHRLEVSFSDLKRKSSFLFVSPVHLTIFL